MNAGKKIRSTGYRALRPFDQANMGAKTDIDTATKSNSEVYDFLKSVSDKYGIGFGNPEQALSIKWYWKIMRFPAV